MISQFDDLWLADLCYFWQQYPRKCREEQDVRRSKLSKVIDDFLDITDKLDISE